MLRLLPIDATGSRSWCCVGLTVLACSSQTTVDLLPTREAGTSGASGSPHGGMSSSVGGSAPVASAGRNGLPAELIHLWDFAGVGALVSDRVGGAIGKVLGGASLDGNGHLRITDGVSYVAFPEYLLSSAESSSITVAAWITWFGGPSWQRVFDFGSTTTNDGSPGQATSQFYFTPRFEPRQFFSVLLDSDSSTSGQAVVEGTATFPMNLATSVVVVLEGDDQTGTTSLRLYLDGARVGESSKTELRLSEFNDRNCWLGQSQWVQDADPLTHWNGEYDEFRIYSRALSELEITNLSLDDPSVL